MFAPLVAFGRRDVDDGSPPGWIEVGRDQDGRRLFGYVGGRSSRTIMFRDIDEMVEQFKRGEPM